MRTSSKTYCLAAFLAATTALPLAAQDLCGGVGQSGQWIGGSEAASDVTTATAYMEQMALVLGGNQYVALFKVSADTEVRVETAGRGAGDTVLDLYDASGAIVLSDDDSGGNGSSRAESMLSAGTYCLAMRSFDNAPMTGFVRVGLLDQEALTEGMAATPSDGGGDGEFVEGDTTCSPDTPAFDLTMGTPGVASVNQTAFWRFTLDTEMPLSISANNTDADPYITLYDNTGAYVAENDDFDGLNSQIDMSTPMAPGTYCLNVRALSDPEAPITVSLFEYDPAAALLAQYDRAEASPPLDGSYPVTDLSVIATRTRQDATLSDKASWYSFEVTESSLMVIEAIANGSGDPSLTLFDDLGRKVGYNDDSGDGYDSLLAARVNPGIYLVAVMDINGDNGMARMSFERFVPAR